MDRLLEIALTNAGSAALMAIGIALTERWVRRPAVIGSPPPSSTP